MYRDLKKLLRCEIKIVGQDDFKKLFVFFKPFFKNKIRETLKTKSPPNKVIKTYASCEKILNRSV